MTAAYEQIVSRMALPVGEVVSKYQAAQISTAGVIELADGTRPLAGIVQYGAESIGDMATVVKGIYPVLVSADVLKGARLKVDVAHPGKFVTALAADDAQAIALMDIDADATGSAILEPSVGA